MLKNKIIFSILFFIFGLNVIYADSIVDVRSVQELKNCFAINEATYTTCRLADNITVTTDDLGGYKSLGLSNKTILNLNGYSLHLDDTFLYLNGQNIEFRDEDEEGKVIGTGKIYGGCTDPANAYLILSLSGNMNFYSGIYEGEKIQKEVRNNSYYDINIYGGNFYSKIVCSKSRLNIYGGYFYNDFSFSFNRTDRLSWLQISGGVFNLPSNTSFEIYNGGAYSSSKKEEVKKLIIKDGYEYTPSTFYWPTTTAFYLPQNFIVTKKLTPVFDKLVAKWDEIDSATSYVISLYKDNEVLEDYNEFEISAENAYYDLEDVILKEGTGCYKFSVGVCVEDICGSIFESPSIDVEVVGITFDSNGGTNVDSILVRKGDKISKPTNPEKKDYNFVGWFIDEELENEFDFDSEIDDNLILYAKWEHIPYTYKFISGDNQEFIEGCIESYSFKIDGDYLLFSSLSINDLELIKDIDYEVIEGSTINFKKFGLIKLNTLKFGIYDVVVKYSNEKDVIGKLTIKEVLVDDKENEIGDLKDDDHVIDNEEINPSTFDDSTKWFILFVIIIAGIDLIVIYIVGQEYSS